MFQGIFTICGDLRTIQGDLQGRLQSTLVNFTGVETEAYTYILIPLQGWSTRGFIKRLALILHSKVASTALIHILILQL